MKKIGFVTTPLTNTNAFRGVGLYTKRLLENLRKLAPSFNFEFLEIRDYLGYRNSDLDIIHYPYFDLFYHTLPIFKKVPTIVTIHDVIPLEFPDHYPPGLRGWFNLQLQKLALRGVERVITVSYHCIKTIHKYLAVPHAKLKLIYEAADPIFRKIPQPKNIYNLPKKFVLYVGDINYNKNIPNLIKACKLAKLPLVMIGKQSAEVEKMDLSHVELQHLRVIDWSGVVRLGFVPDEDLVDIYNLAAVYCQPSLSEGFGLPVVEALACGTAVACSRTSSLPEVAGEAAIYFNPYNVREMAEAIFTAQNSKLKTQNKDRFTWEKTALATIQVYQEIL